MEPDASTDFQQLISEIFEQQPNDGLKGVLRCFLLDDKFQMVYDYKSKLESGGSYLAGTFLRSDTIDKDLTVFNHMSETFDTGKKMEEFFGEQQFYTSKIFGGQFSLCVVYVKGEKPGVVWSLGNWETVGTECQEFVSVFESVKSAQRTMADIPCKSILIDIFYEKKKQHLKNSLNIEQIISEFKLGDFVFTDIEIMVSVKALFDDGVLNQTFDGFSFEFERFDQIIQEVNMLKLQRSSQCAKSEAMKIDEIEKEAMKTGDDEHYHVENNEEATGLTPMLNTLSFSSLEPDKLKPDPKQIQSTEKIGTFPYYPNVKRKADIDKSLTKRLTHPDAMTAEIYNSLCQIGAKKYLSQGIKTNSTGTKTSRYKKSEPVFEKPVSILGVRGKGNCFLAGLNKGYFEISGKLGKSELNKILFEIPCPQNCGQILKITVLNVLSQPDIGGESYQNNGHPNGPIRCKRCCTNCRKLLMLCMADVKKTAVLDEEKIQKKINNIKSCNCEKGFGFYVTGLCKNQPKLDYGMNHNHCTSCVGLGTCLEDSRLGHCRNCNKHNIDRWTDYCEDCKPNRCVFSGGGHMGLGRGIFDFGIQIKNVEFNK